MISTQSRVFGCNIWWYDTYFSMPTTCFVEIRSRARLVSFMCDWCLDFFFSIFWISHLQVVEAVHNVSYLVSLFLSWVLPSVKLEGSKFYWCPFFGRCLINLSPWCFTFKVGLMPWVVLWFLNYIVNHLFEQCKLTWNRSLSNTIVINIFFLFYVCGWMSPRSKFDINQTYASCLKTI